MKLANIKIAKLWYWCGWGGVCVGVASIIWGIVVGEMFPVAHGIGWLIVGFGFNRIGASEIKRFKSLNGDLGQLRKVLQESQEQFTAFQKENCVGCKFADEVTMRNFTAWNFKKWCLRPEPPELSKDSKWCYSRERK